MNLILDKRYTNTVRACYLTSVSTSVTGNLSPLLFLTFRELYGLSFAEMGLLVLINFTTQLLVDLLFSFFSHRLSAERCVRATPLVIAAGLAVFALLPRLLPDAAMAGLVLGTVVFSAGSGLAEVLTSPTVSAVPSSNSERLLSRLHAAYAWGVVAVVPLSTLFLYFTDATLWWVLPLGFTVLPLVAALLFYTSPTPPVDDAHGGAEQGTRARLPRGVMALCFFCIFFGGAAECTMAQWCSGYIEEALGIPKLWGDIFGVALFGAALGLGRTLYSAFGKRITPCLFYGSLGACVCYLVAVLSPFAIVSLIACAATGFFVSMLWPGSLIAASERMPHGGVMMYALMAAGGDLGAALIPQGVGVVADLFVLSPAFAAFADALGMQPEQLGMRAGLLIAALFPLGCALVVWRLSNIRPATVKLPVGQ